MNLIDKIKKLPDNPGIYLFYNSKKELIYVGKATSLRDRVGSYFRLISSESFHKKTMKNFSKEINSDKLLLETNKKVSDKKNSSLRFRSGWGINLRPIEQMIHEVVNIKTIETDSVLEAIILEANTIKKYQPKYNISLKDDKSWNYIVITNDDYPKVFTMRQHELNNSKFKVQNFKFTFGPYPGLKTNEMMKLLRKLFYISTCSPLMSKQVPSLKNNESKQKKPCFYYQLGQCLGVCVGEISSKEYKREVIQPLVKFLRGNKKGLKKNLQKKMLEASGREDFEEAGRLRDQIKNLQKIQDIALLNKSFLVNNFESETKNSKLRIEGYDISNFGSSNIVGSMVVFENGEANKNEYRKFKIKNIEGQNDIDCLAEVIERRLKHQEWLIPQIILVDGGLSQVNKTVEILCINKFKIPVVGIAKGSTRKKNEFIIGFKNKEFVNWVNKNKELLIKVRDEAHRFAINYQKSLRKIK